MKLTLLLILLFFATRLHADAPASTPPSKEAYLRIAAEVESNLQHEILDKFFPITADEKNGGFFEDYSLDWKLNDRGNKSIVYQSRLTWTSAQSLPCTRSEPLPCTRAEPLT